MGNNQSWSCVSQEFPHNAGNPQPPCKGSMMPRLPTGTYTSTSTSTCTPITHNTTSTSNNQKLIRSHTTPTCCGLYNHCPVHYALHPSATSLVDCGLSIFIPVSGIDISQVIRPTPPKHETRRRFGLVRLGFGLATNERCRNVLLERGF